MTTTIVPFPAGHMKLYPWEDDDGQPIRPFKGSSWTVEATDGNRIEVDIWGVQTPRGVERTISVEIAESQATPFHW